MIGCNRAAKIGRPAMLRIALPLAVVLLVVIVLVTLPVNITHRASAQSPNLLTNPGFEDEGRWLFQDGIREIQVPPGWFAFWRSIPPADLLLPSNCPHRSDTGCYWARPEFRDVKATEFPDRVHSGLRALRYFTFGRMHEAGLYQAVESIPVGARVRFSVWLQAWMCADASDCMGGRVSDAPAHMHLQVGLDPKGSIDPWSSDIVWSPEGEAFDRWQQFQVEATPEAGVATVFIRSRPNWDWPRLNNDVYVDDARLEILALPTPANMSNTLPGVRYILTPTPDRPVTHTVAAGETLGSIALAHGVSVEQIIRLNRLSPRPAIWPDQALLIDVPERTGLATEPISQSATALPAPSTRQDSPRDWITWGLGGLLGALVLWALTTARRMRSHGED